MVSYWPAKDAPGRSSAAPEDRTATGPPSSARARASRPPRSSGTAPWARMRSTAAVDTTTPGGTGKPSPVSRARLAALWPARPASLAPCSSRPTTAWATAVGCCRLMTDLLPHASALRRCCTDAKSMPRQWKAPTRWHVGSDASSQRCWSVLLFLLFFESTEDLGVLLPDLLDAAQHPLGREVRGHA